MAEAGGEGRGERGEGRGERGEGRGEARGVHNYNAMR